MSVDDVISELRILQSILFAFSLVSTFLLGLIAGYQGR